MTVDHLWAGWRLHYVSALVGGSGDPDSEFDAGSTARPVLAPGQSLFEAIFALEDAEGFVVHRGKEVGVLLNAYPYTNGHMMVLPLRAVTTLGALTDDEHDELWRVVRSAVRALEVGYRCGGVNVGLNMGAGAGAGIPEHLHVHVVPRWAGDTNFMTTTANARVLPESLESSWARLRDAWE